MASDSRLIDHPSLFILDQTIGTIIALVLIGLALYCYERCTHDERIKKIMDHEW